jgi:hypothetical protein
MTSFTFRLLYSRLKHLLHPPKRRLDASQSPSGHSYGAEKNDSAGNPITVDKLVVSSNFTDFAVPIYNSSSRITVKLSKEFCGQMEVSQDFHLEYCNISGGTFNAANMEARH